MSIVYYNVKLSDVLPRLRRVLESDSRVKIAVVFGSILKGGLVRDVDVAVYTDPPLELKELLLLGDELERAVGVPVDLVPLCEVEPKLQYNILMKGLPIIVRDEDLYNKLALQALGQMQDLGIKVRQELKHSLQRRSGGSKN